MICTVLGHVCVGSVWLWHWELQVPTFDQHSEDVWNCLWKWWVTLSSWSSECLWWRNIVVVPLHLRWCFVLIIALPLLGIYWGVRVLGWELLEWLPLLFYLLILRLLEVLPFPSLLILRG